MTIDGVSDWLESLELSQHQQMFKENEINGRELLGLNNDMLKNDLHVGEFFYTLLRLFSNIKIIWKY